MGGGAEGTPHPLFYVMITPSREAIFLEAIQMKKTASLYMEPPLKRSIQNKSKQAGNLYLPLL